MKDFDHLQRLARHGLAAAVLAASTWAGASSDLADVPLGTMTDGTAVRSNLMFILDDSGSMGWDFLPDTMNVENVCFGVASRNRVFYDPSKTYLPPIKADGTPYPNASFTAAYVDGYLQSGTTRNLSNLNNLNTPSIDHDGNSKTVKTKFYWATLKPGQTHNCDDPKRYDIKTGGLTDAEKQNYANWYSYYRTRMLAMRAGVGRAFAAIDASRFRVGYSTISETGVADNSRFLNIKEFDAGTHKQDFFDRLYAAQPSGWTPLRPALEKAGRYFAKKVDNQTVDPMQYSCQRNYTILSTDGYWNTNAEGNYRSGYVPWKLDNTALGNVDAGSSVPRPMRDEVGGGGVGNTLADIAYYFYNTDLRSPALGNCSGAVTGQDVCENNVPDGILRPPALSMLSDTAKHQHMTTFTIGLGVSGTLAFDPNYESQTSGDFYDLRQGNKVWPNPITNTGAERIDDLWHAAVNGRGTYYSANDAAQLAQNLTDAMKKIEAIVGSASAAATSSLTPSSGDDWLFVPLYSTKTWDGTVNAFKINTATGEKTSETPLWSASDRISTQSSRTIYFRSGGSLVSFEYGNLSSAQKGYFDGLCASGAEKLTQCASLSATAKAKVTGTNVVNYLRGVKTYETSATATDDQLFRKRDTPLGDIVNGAPVYVKKPPFKYTDDGYADFVAANAGRQAVLYVGANDGMLHAIKVDTVENGGGTELWAYVPSMVMPHMHVLADTAYESKHRFYVDGAPVVADVQDADGNWRTILVGGLGKGGRGYYALDVTNPTSPKSLWEYTDEDLGFTYGNPVVAKNKDGRWIVAFSSGYNNVSPGDGKGYLYVLDAVTGDKIKKIGTGVGSTSAPSNLGKINAWVDDQSDNVALRIYGADMLGNVWRFDFDDNLSGDDAFLLGTTGAGQPITTKPVLSEVVAGAYKYAVVTVATGRYLGLSDIGDDTVQSIYSFKDDLSTTGLGNLRSNPGMVKQTLKSDRSGLDSPATVTWASHKGWYIDLSLSEGERVNVDFDQQMNQLIVASNIPKPSVCSPGGTSWLYYFDIANGKVLLTYEGSTLVAGITTILSSTGKLITLVQGVDGRNTPRQGAEPSSTPSGTLRRTSWRELVD
ncbi:pilus assembly protein PilY [Calidifontimicrobium sp. SYSU G02091]|uniref:pilus assembly protein n=1 Tax=Calidifontimicrobium sp. SYSU G02091 TaxID=2926421 RepID=UPI001F53CB93|nr:PilC/PilY family type IV pilus protein [Calidifontimicrobium sp. SYSU G02091]MCI1190470.1 pilus assembly protein PilY [Calidifontimicrobium sp. SYSU G02091]